MRAYNREDRLVKIIQAPVISEKSTFAADKQQQIVFRVIKDANKHEIKAAVELLFKVTVKAVNTANVKGKQKRFGRLTGRRKDWKKAYVCLAPGQEIDFAATDSKG